MGQVYDFVADFVMIENYSAQFSVSWDRARAAKDFGRPLHGFEKMWPKAVDLTPRESEAVAVVVFTNAQDCTDWGNEGGEPFMSEEFEAVTVKYEQLVWNEWDC